MPLLHVLRVFTDSDGAHGNPLGVFMDGGAISEPQRQPIATTLGFSETVFLGADGSLRLYTPASELPFAGHPLVGTAWLLEREHRGLRHLKAPAGAARVWQEDELTWISGRTECCPSWTHVQASSVSDVEQASEAPAGHDHVQLWAFENEATGVIRARTFAPRFGVTEDEACGSASMVLAKMLNRPLVIHHGKGSEIFVRPGSDGTISLGGRVQLHKKHDVSLLDAASD